MKKLSSIPVVLALALAVAAPVSAATPSAALRSQLRVQKAKVAKLKTELAAAKTTNRALANSFARAQTDLVTRTAERDAANASLAAQTTLTGQVAAGAVTGLSADQLWGVIAAIYPLMPNASGCGLSKSYYASAPYFNYSFTSFGC